MLLDFTFKNVRSFKDTVTFSMETGEYITKLQKKNTCRQKDIRLLKSTYILGGNATGKSNVLRAFDILRQVVLVGTPSELSELFTDTYASNTENTEFQIRFFKNNKLFTYMLIYNSDYIAEESLAVNQQIVFKRSQSDLQVPSLLEHLKGALRQNQPLLYFAQDNNVPEAKEAYEWFRQDIISPRLYGYAVLDQQIFRPLLVDSELKDNLLYFLQAADFNILDIKVTEIISEEHEEIKRKQLQVDFIHKSDDGYTFTLNWSAESSGTKIFIMLAMHFIQRVNKNTLFIIDEFDRSLHPKLVRILIRLFNEWNTHNQFIVTTHNHEILNDNLRVDQIWFVDKNYQGVSELYSAFDFDETSLTMHQLKKNYQNGLYGGDQIIDEDGLLAILREQHG